MADTDRTDEDDAAASAGEKPDAEPAEDEETPTTASIFHAFRRKSPFTGLFEHAEKVRACVALFESATEDYVAHDLDAFHEKVLRVGELEHEADLIKSSIRAHLPKFILMPVDKGHFELCLHSQDEILDYVENVMEMMDMRHTHVPEALLPAFRAHRDKVVATVEEYERTVENLRDLLDAGFGKREREQTKDVVKSVHQLEYEADRARYEFARGIYAMEDELEPMDVYHLLKIADWVDNIADAAENAADMIRAMLAK